MSRKSYSKFKISSLSHIKWKREDITFILFLKVLIWNIRI